MDLVNCNNEEIKAAASVVHQKAVDSCVTCMLWSVLHCLLVLWCFEKQRERQMLRHVSLCLSRNITSSFSFHRLQFQSVNRDWGNLDRNLECRS